MLCAYELKRLENMKSNEEVLIQLGLAEPKTTELEMEKKKRNDRHDKDDSDHERTLPPTRRMQPKRGEGQKRNYSMDYDYDELDRLEEQIKIKKQKSTSRNTKRPRYYADEDFEPKIKRFKMKSATNIHSASYQTRNEEKRYSQQQSKVFTSNVSFSNSTGTHPCIPKMFQFGFVTKELKNANYDEKYVRAFQQYCDSNASKRFGSKINNNLQVMYSDTDIAMVAQAITNKDDLSSYDQQLCQRYIDACLSFTPSEHKLAQYDPKRFGVNPLVICKLCKLPFALNANAQIRSHVCEHVPPTITLIGSKTVIIQVGECSYVEQGAFTDDDSDVIITYTLNGLSVETIDTNAHGLYTVKYNATDFKGYCAKEIQRNVYIEPEFVKNYQ